MHDYDILALILILIILGGIAYTVVFSLHKKWYTGFGTLPIVPGLILLFFLYSIGPDRSDDEDAWIHSFGHAAERKRYLGRGRKHRV
jgi:uncharacterized BrkB/YihY/UPF0761 family membrane protein